MTATGVRTTERTSRAQASPEHGYDKDAHELSSICQRMANKLPKAHPSRTLLEQLADAISDALDTR